MNQELEMADATAQCLNGGLENSHFKEVLEWLATDPAIVDHIPDQTCQLDPRDGSMVVYSTARSKRFHDTVKDVLPVAQTSGDCPICNGKITRILDLTRLSEGFTFISQNLFPILNPAPRLADELLVRAIYPDPQHTGRVAYGMHLLQWTSSIHDHDWHNMTIDDLKIVLQRLANLERRLVRGASGYMPSIAQDNDFLGSFSVIKNYGGAAGASLSHGHQQIAFSNIMPQRAFNNWSFYRRHKRTFSQYMLTENPESLTIAEWTQWRLIVPYFMQRPLAMMLIHRGKECYHLFDLDEIGLMELAKGIQTAICLLLTLIPSYNRPPAFNFAIHNGPDNNVYVEFFPITQTIGGFERLGMWVCQENPSRVAERLRETFEQLSSRQAMT
jgi:galactose-1-phosphate uridylyltransferase